jgi:hypothetical protein
MMKTVHVAAFSLSREVIKYYYPYTYTVLVRLMLVSVEG